MDRAAGEGLAQSTKNICDSIQRLSVILKTEDHFWTLLNTLVTCKVNEVELYKAHLWDQNAELHTMEVPPHGLWEVLPLEVIELIFSFVPIRDVLKIVGRVCKMFGQVTKEDNSLFWKSMLTKQWSKLVQGKPYSSVTLDEVEYGVVEGGGHYRAAISLALSHPTAANRTGWMLQYRSRLKLREVYAGAWRNDKRNGKGVFHGTRGYKCQGNWKDDLIEGNTVQMWPDGETYEGEMSRGEADGFGVYKWADGRVYEGQWKKDKREGQGTMSWPSGTKYEGNWALDNWHGRGKYKLPSGTTYDGEFIRGVKDGWGVMAYDNGDVYEGTWQADEKHGWGKMKYANGDDYEGGWVVGKKEGLGLMKYANGEVVDGQWRADSPPQDKNVHHLSTK